MFRQQDGPRTRSFDQVLADIAVLKPEICPDDTGGKEDAFRASWTYSKKAYLLRRMAPEALKRPTCRAIWRTCWSLHKVIDLAEVDDALMEKTCGGNSQAPARLNADLWRAENTLPVFAGSACSIWACSRSWTYVFLSPKDRSMPSETPGASQAIKPRKRRTLWAVSSRPWRPIPASSA